MMSQLAIPRQTPMTASEQLRRASRTQAVWIIVLAGVAVLTGLTTLSGEVSPSLIAWIIYIAGAIAILREPRHGLYLSIFFTLIADKSLMLWYPFVSNFSSRESIMFISTAVKVSPLEVYLVLMFVSWLAHCHAQGKLNFNAGVMTGPVLIWIAFVAFGLGYGFSRGGNTTIALWEARPMFYMLAALVLVSNLVQTRQQVNRLIWLAMIAILIQGLVGLYTYLVILQGQASRIESIIEHAAAIRMDSLFVLLITAWMFKASRAKRFVLPIFAAGIFVTYMVAQRRAAFVSLGMGLVAIGMVLFMVNRKRFWQVAPVVCVVLVLYMGAFWNNQGTLGLPVRAVKSMLISDSGNSQENSSNDYRVTENINNMFTIKAAPLTGVGFGRPFYIIAPLPDISFFEWWQYIVHNSIMWMWMETGIGGYFSMLVMIGLALVYGMQTTLRMPGGDMSAIALTAVTYIFMHFVYAYVDMSWDGQSMLYIGIMMGLINQLRRIVARPIDLPNHMPAPMLTTTPSEVHS
jgi:hypothetical protein